MGKWRTQEDDRLRCDEQRDRDVGPAVRHRQEERLQVLRLRNGIRTGQYDRPTIG